MGGKNFKIVLKIIVQFLLFRWLFKNVSFCQPYEKVHIMKKMKFFLEPSDQKNGFPTQFTTKITVYWPKFFFKIFEKIGRNYDFFIHFPPPPNKELKTGGWRLWVELLPSSSNFTGKLLYLVQDISWCRNLLAQH